MLGAGLPVPSFVIWGDHILFFILYGIAMLMGILLVNIKIHDGQLKLYEWLVRVVCAIGMAYNLISSLFSASPSEMEHDALLFLLITGLLTFPQFLFSDYIQYRKRPDDIELAKQAVGKAVIWIAAVLCYLAVIIWFYVTI